MPRKQPTTVAPQNEPVCTCRGEHTTKGRHVTSVDTADAEMILDIVEALRDNDADTGTRKAAGNTIARLLADKREEWLLVAMTRAERIFGLTRRDGT